ncbi:MAG: hypothetical protein ACI4T5_02495 [Prevotella sp.]
MEEIVFVEDGAEGSATKSPRTVAEKKARLAPDSASTGAEGRRHSWLYGAATTTEILGNLKVKSIN